MKTLEELESYIKELASENTAELKGCKENIQKATTTIEKAEKDIAEAEAEVDAKKYSKAKEALWTAKHTKELYLKQKEKLEKNPIIDQKEYRNLLHEIMGEAKEIQDEQNRRAAELVNQIKEISDESVSTNKQANDLLHILQYDVYKDADALVAANGTVITRAKEYQNEKSVSHFFRNKVSGTFLADLAGIEEEPQRKNCVFF
ncbi:MULTISPECIES: hypothetical protein [Enterococcus]|uniref:hypothetical protein n=1 Tax=Enterococcus TaxID=1350 RepID=UPI0010F43418|nr:MULTISPECIES: hypothetical protein [Enterococcus]MBM7710632.1 chromosome segregation ATPase [Enterococcus xiangfangensis]MDT2501021.1 hypothetical protein [Enterococcus avium]